MAATFRIHEVLLSFRTFAQTSPTYTVFLLCALIVLFTRIRTGYEKSRRQNLVAASEKAIPVLPYWLPFLGHGPSFAWSFDDLLASGRDTTTDGIFGLHMLGSQHYVVVMPSLVKQFFLKRPTTLSGEDFVIWIMHKYFGDGGAAKEIGTEKFQTVHRTLNSLMKEPFLSSATAKTVQLVQEKTAGMISLSAGGQQVWEEHANIVSDGDTADVDLFPLTMDYIAEISANALLGHQFMDNNPCVTRDLWIFDSGFNAFLTGIPYVTPGLSKARAARARLQAAFLDYNTAILDTIHGRSVEERWNDLSDVSETMRIRTKALESVNGSEAFSIAQNLAVYWGLMVNATKVHFWLLLHIISSPTLLPTIRKEIAPYAATNGGTTLRIDIDNIIASCPVLKAAFFETMRLYTAGVSYKRVLQEVILTESAEDAAILGKPRPQTYHIKAGNFLVIPHATMQTDPRLWENPKEFDPYRFIVVDETDPKSMRAEMGDLHAFGGGSSICKGRLFAEREILIFVAGMLTAWDFSPVRGSWKIPGKSYNGTGSANPKENVRVRMGRRL